MSDRPLYLHAVTSLARVILLLALAGPAVPGLGAQEAEAEALPTIEAKTEGMIAHDGFKRGQYGPAH